MYIIIGSMVLCSCYLTFRLHLLQTAFRTKAMEVHPDQNQDDRGKHLLFSGHCVSSNNSNVVASWQSLFTNTTNVWTGAEAAEEKFKEVVKSYEAIKSERKNGVSWCKLPRWSDHAGKTGISCNLPCICNPAVAGSLMKWYLLLLLRACSTSSIYELVRCRLG